jgi:hypothetical protein
MLLFPNITFRRLNRTVQQKTGYLLVENLDDSIYDVQGAIGREDCGFSGPTTSMMCRSASLSGCNHPTIYRQSRQVWDAAKIDEIFVTRMGAAGWRQRLRTRQGSSQKPLQQDLVQMMCVQPGYWPARR